MKTMFSAKVLAIVLMTALCLCCTGCPGISIPSVNLNTADVVAEYKDSTLPAFNIKADNVSLSLIKSNSDVINVSSGFTGAMVNVDADSSLNMLNLASPTSVVFYNKKAKDGSPSKVKSIFQITVYPSASGSALSEMPSQLILKPGAWVMVGGARYENTSKEFDLVLPIAEKNSSDNKRCRCNDPNICHQSLGCTNCANCTCNP